MARDRTAFALSRRYRAAKIVEISGAISSRELLVELAWDGHRVLACRAGDELRIVSPDFREWSETFPMIARALMKLPAKRFVIEGWICALSPEGARPSFDLLRAYAERSAQPRVLFAISDLLHLDEDDLRSRALRERRTSLTKLLEETTMPLALSGALSGTIDESLAMARALGAPGLLVRALDGRYDEDAWHAIACGDRKVIEPKSLSPKPVVTNATKVLYPRDGITKQQVVDYYASIADVLLPHLRDRPVVCQRWPDGIDEFTWYQHRLPPKAPDYLRSVPIENDRRIVIDDARGLLWLANQAALTFHGWASRVSSLDRPDVLTIDLDPGTSTTWAQTIEVAIGVRKLLELLELPSVIKTSGQRGLHVMVPIAPRHAPTEVHEVARRMCALLAKTMPALVSIEPAIEDRRGRLYLDHQQSFVGKSLVSAYSLRAADGAPVSAPLDWSEVTTKLDPKAFTIHTMRARIDAVGDRAAPLLAASTSLDHALSRLPD